MSRDCSLVGVTARLTAQVSAGRNQRKTPKTYSTWYPRDDGRPHATTLGAPVGVHAPVRVLLCAKHPNVHGHIRMWIAERGGGPGTQHRIGMAEISMCTDFQVT
jgi:hypothetical protein